MSRAGRSQPIQPFASHGFVDPGPGPVGTVPPRAVVVDSEDRRRRIPPQQPIIISGSLSSFIPPSAAPPPPLSIDRADQRGRYRPLDPVILSAALAGFTSAPTPTPPGPFVVPLEERKRFLAALPPTVSSGRDDSDPPPPNVVEPDNRIRRIRLPDPVTLVGPAPDTTQQATPPAPVVVFIDGVRRLLLQPTITHGFVDPGPGPVGTTPPPVNVVPLVERRMFFVALAPLLYKPFVEPVISPPATGVNQDVAPIIAGW